MVGKPTDEAIGQRVSSDALASCLFHLGAGQLNWRRRRRRRRAECANKQGLRGVEASVDVDVGVDVDVDVDVSGN